MSLVGNLEDLGLGEILQIVSLSRKSGILALHSRGREGNVVFRQGMVVRATSTTYQQNLGEVLVQKGVLDVATLNKALAFQEEGGFRERLGTVLISHFGVADNTIEEVVREQIENVVYSLFAWVEGTFDFELQDSVEVSDSIRMDPLQFMLEQGLNPQFLAMEGSRIIDEMRHRGESPDEAHPTPDVPQPAPHEEIDDFAFHFVETPAQAVPAPIEKRPVIDEVPPRPVLVNIGDELRLEMGEAPAQATAQAPQSTGISLLRRMMEELYDPALGGGIILLVLRFASEFMNRAVVFFVKRDEIAGLGQFGIDNQEGVADSRVRNLRIPRKVDSLFTPVIDSQLPVKLQPDDTDWNRYLLAQLGGGVPAEVFLGPIVSEGKVVAILYGDNLPGATPIGDTDALEIFLSQAGLAMEKALLVRRLKEKSSEGP
ncbi:MAG TPA: DUF4388 domain-containing protein [Geobacteraceae bacterium]